MDRMGIVRIAVIMMIIVQISARIESSIIWMISIVWISIRIWIIWISVGISTVIRRGILAVVAIGRITTGRGERGDERDGNNAPGHGEPRPITKHRVCHPR
jgi:hypothetical protein